MSAFAPMNVLGASQQKRQLIQKLMEQYQQHSARAAGLGASGGPSTAAASLPNSRPFGGAGHLTGALPNLAQSLIARLGPGGFGHPIAGRENSPAPGVDVARGLYTNPHTGSVLSPGGGAGAPIPAGGISAASPAVPAAAPATPIAGPGSLPGSTGDTYQASTPSGAPAGPALVDPGFMTTSSAPVALGNGLYYDPNTQTVVQGNPAAATPQLPAARGVARAI